MSKIILSKQMSRQKTNPVACMHVCKQQSLLSILQDPASIRKILFIVMKSNEHLKQISTIQKNCVECCPHCIKPHCTEIEGNRNNLFKWK